MKLESMRQDRLNFILGKYISVGVNQPEKYPKDPLLSEKEEVAQREMTDDEMERKVEMLNKLYGGTIKIKNGN